MLKRGTADAYNADDLRTMFEESISNLSIDDLKKSYQGEVVNDDGDKIGRFILTYAVRDRGYYYTFMLSRVWVNDSTCVFSVLNVESGLTVLTVTCTGSSWSCERGGIARSITIDILRKIQKVM